MIASFPHNPTTAIATPGADAAARRPRARARVHPRPRLRLRRRRLRRPRPALGAPGGGRARVRGRALLADQVLLDGRLARGLHARPARRRRRARQAQVLPRLRHLPADPDRVDRGAARGRATTRPRSARSTAAAATRSAPASTAPAGTSSRRRGRCSSGRRSPSSTRELGSLEFALKLAREADVAVSPGIGFGPGGDGHVRFALVENEQRINQATRSIRRLLQGQRRSRGHGALPTPSRRDARTWRRRPCL